VLHKSTQKQYAMKSMQKAKIMWRESFDDIMLEQQLLRKLHHPFLVNMQYAFQDRENVYLVSDLMSGGDLRYNHAKVGQFGEEQVKFIVGCLAVALEYIH
jgi:serine/threonine protein kinase